MTKFLAWILAVVVVGAIALAATGFLAYRAARPAIESARGYVAGFGGELDELEKKIVNRRPYTAPADGALTQDQVDRFVRVQQGVLAALGQRVRDIEEKYQHLKVNADDPKPPHMGEVMQALSELSGVLVDARRAQVDALNHEKFSSAEYDWVRKQFYRAAGVNSVNRRLGELQKMVTSNESASVAETSMVNAPAPNRELVRPYQRYVDDWLPLLFFGL
jgi:hypothetical protein